MLLNGEKTLQTCQNVYQESNMHFFKLNFQDQTNFELENVYSFERQTFPARVIQLALKWAQAIPIEVYVKGETHPTKLKRRAKKWEKKRSKHIKSYSQPPGTLIRAHQLCLKTTYLERALQTLVSWANKVKRFLTATPNALCSPFGAVVAVKGWIDATAAIWFKRHFTIVKDGSLRGFCP